MQRGSLWMLLREIAQENTCVASAQQTLRNGLRFRRDAHGGHCGIHRNALLFANRLDHLRQQIRQLRWCDNRPCAEGNQCIIINAVQQADLRPALGRLAQALRDQRVVFSDERTDDQYAVQLRQFGNAHAQPWRAVAFPIRREIAMPQARVQIPAAQAAQQFLRQIQFLQRGMRAEQATDGCATLSLCRSDVTQSMGRVIKRDIPFDFVPHAILFDHWPRQARGRIQRLIRETVLVGEPAFVDVFVFKRQHTHHAAMLGLHNQVTAQTVVRADCFAAG